MANMIGKRGSLQDTIYIGVALVAFIVAATIGFYINAQFSANAIVQASPNASAITAITTDFYCGTPDNLGLAIFFGSLVVAVMLAYLFGQSAIFKAITVVFLILFTGATVMFQLWWEGYGSNSSIADFVACMPKTAWLMGHFVLVGLLCSSLIIIALFYKSRGSEGAF